MKHCHDHNCCVQQAVERAEQLCAQSGLRFTPLRRRVFELIWQRHVPAKAYDILDALQAQRQQQAAKASIKPATVYRALNFLLELGLIHKLNSLNAYVGCAQPHSKHSSCYFLICDDCEVIEECCDPEVSDVIELIANDNHFHLGQVTLEIRGQCQSCKGKEQRL